MTTAGIIHTTSRRGAFAGAIAETTIAFDTLDTGSVIFATLVDDPASVSDHVDAFNGQLMVEAVSATATVTVGTVLNAAIVEEATATATYVIILPATYSGTVAETVTATATPDASSFVTYSGTVAETATAADSPDASVPVSPPLDAVASVTGAWSLSRDMLTSFAGGTRYTTGVGSEVVTLEDQSGNNRDFSNTAGVGVCPVAVTAFPASVLCADFDGSNDSLVSVATSNFFTSSSGALVVSVIIDAASANSATSFQNHAIFYDPSGIFMGLFARALSGVTFYAYNWDGNEDNTTVTGSVGTAYVLMWRHHGGNLYVSINGGTETSVASGNTSNMASLLRLSGGSGSAACNMKVAELFTTSNGSQTTALATAIANMKAYVGA